MMRSGYGQSAIEYPVFDGLAVESFERLVLRNSGNDWHGCNPGWCTNGSHLRDAVMHRMVAGLGLEVLAYRPASTWINGEYWGIYNLRERSDRQFIESHLGHEDIDLLEFFGGVVEGDAAHYEGLLEVVRTEDLAAPETYAKVQRLMDVDNFATYQIVQIFHDNQDWPGNNIKFWRPRTPEGRWRWLLYDTDFGLGLRDSDPRADTLAFALRPDGDGWPNPPWSTELLRALVQSPQFVTDFVNRYADYLNTTLRPEVTRPILWQAAATIAPEMPRHLDRWGRASSPGGPSMRPGTWEAQIDAIGEWLQARPAFARAHLARNFDLEGTYELELRVDPPDSGTLRLTAVTVEAPFTGTYFVGVPVTVTAVPAEGYVWSGWSAEGAAPEPTLVLEPVGDTILTARFEPQP